MLHAVNQQQPSQACTVKAPTPSNRSSSPTPSPAHLLPPPTGVGLLVVLDEGRGILVLRLHHVLQELLVVLRSRESVDRGGREAGRVTRGTQQQLANTKQRHAVVAQKQPAAREQLPGGQGQGQGGLVQQRRLRVEGWPVR